MIYNKLSIDTREQREKTTHALMKRMNSYTEHSGTLCIYKVQYGGREGLFFFPAYDAHKPFFKKKYYKIKLT